jgi:hypothetical protein
LNHEEKCPRFQTSLSGRVTGAAAGRTRRDSEATPQKGGRNFTYYANPEYDRLIDEAMATPDRVSFRYCASKGSASEEAPGLLSEQTGRRERRSQRAERWRWDSNLTARAVSFRRRSYLESV